MNIVIFSGGRGSISLIKSLRTLYKNIHFKIIVNTYDDGKSSGKLRFRLNMPGPSDMRKIHEIFINNKNSSISKLYKKRINCDFLFFKKKLEEFCLIDTKKFFDIEIESNIIRNELKKYTETFLKKIKNNEISIEDFSITNILYAGAYFFYNKDINLTMKKIEDLFNLNVEVISCGNKNLFLSGINQNNKIFFNESQIVEQRSNVNMKQIFLTKKPLRDINFSQFKKYEIINFIKKSMVFDKISLNAKNAILTADIILYSSGTPYSSLYPSYFTKGISDAISKNNNSIKILITNIGSDYETPDFNAEDYLIKTLEYLNYHSKYATKDLINEVIINKPKSNKSNYVKPFENFSKYKDLRFHVSNLENSKKLGQHSVEKLKKILRKILF